MDRSRRNILQTLLASLLAKNLGCARAALAKQGERAPLGAPAPFDFDWLRTRAKYLPRSNGFRGE